MVGKEAWVPPTFRRITKNVRLPPRISTLEVSMRDLEEPVPPLKDRMAVLGEALYSLLPSRM
jgi:hypothetical protein